VSRNAHAAMGSSEARNEVDVITWSPPTSNRYGYSTVVRGEHPSTEELSTSDFSDFNSVPYSLESADERGIYRTVDSSAPYRGVSHAPGVTRVNSMETIGGNSGLTPSFRTEARAKMAGEAMAKRIVEGRSVRTGKSD
jgi:hypothetical protein